MATRRNALCTSPPRICAVATEMFSWWLWSWVIVWGFPGTCRHTSVFVWMFWPQGAIMGVSALDLLSQTIAYSATAVIVKLWVVQSQFAIHRKKTMQAHVRKAVRIRTCAKDTRGTEVAFGVKFPFFRSNRQTMRSTCTEAHATRVHGIYRGMYQNAVLSDDVEHFSGTRNTTCRSAGAKLSAI